jgi:hypothetical protein
MKTATAKVLDHEVDVKSRRDTVPMSLDEIKSLLALELEHNRPTLPAPPPSEDMLEEDDHEEIVIPLVNARGM